MDLSSKIQKQVEFYFSDSNFAKDKFLRALAASNEEGYCPISTLLSFSRLKALTTDVSLIIEALKKSNVVQVNEDGTMVKRKNALPDTDTSIERSIYAKGWSEGTTIEQVESALSKYGKILSVRIRKTKEKTPKDSAFIEFSTIDEAKSTLAEPIKMGDKELVIKMRADYQQLKKEQLKKAREDKKRKSDDSSSKSESKEKTKVEEKEKEKFAKGVLISFKAVGAETSREILKEVFGEFGKVAFVDFNRGDAEGWIRFDLPEDAKKAVDGLTESKKEINGVVPTLSIVSDEDSDAYWEKLQTQRKSSRGGGSNRGKGSTRGKKMRRRF